MKTLATKAQVAAHFSKTGRRAKYRNKKTIVDGITFDSKKEAARWGDLQLLAKVGQVSDLKRQVRFDLLLNGEKLGAYVADFVYVRNGKRVVEDTKGFKTPMYRLKKKMMKAIFGIEILET